jgi:hypothetical protein
MIRSVSLFLLVTGTTLLAFLAGSGEIDRWRSDRAPPFPLLVENIAPEKECALTEHKAFAIVLYAHNTASWCERSLRSIFAQDYDYFRVLFVDDGSIDATFEKAQQFIVDNGLEERVVAVRNETKAGRSASLYRAAQTCLDKEILVPLDACNWMAHESVLTKLNRVFQNPDAWIAFGSTIEYPFYTIRKAPEIDSAKIERKGFSSFSSESISCAFYAGLFKSIRLPDLFTEGTFSESPSSWQVPLLEQSGGRWRILSDPLVFENRAHPLRGAPQAAITSARSPYRPLAELPLPSIRQKESQAEVVLFSYDRPLQLYATLESIQSYLRGSESLTLLYRASDTRFEAAYADVLAAFPEVRAVRQMNRKDFKPLLEQILFEASSEYVLFSADDVVMKDFVDLSLCAQMLDRTGAYGFYLRFGRNIGHSYISGKSIALPPSAELGNGVFAWDVGFGEADWGTANNFEMSLYRKEDLKEHFSQISYRDPQALQKEWTERLPEHSVGLYFEQSKMVNLPLNAVQSSGKPNMNYMTAEELLLKFNQGFKIDIEPLFQVNNPAPHYDWAPELIQR